MDLEDDLLMIPGPVPLAPRVLRAMSRPMMSHRGRDFEIIFSECVDMLREVYQTRKDVLILSGSGSLAMEAAIGCLAGGDRVVNLVNGKFGDRFHQISKRYGRPTVVDATWGESLDLDRVEEELAEGAKIITMCHNETSTGILNPAREVGELAREYDAYFVMDGVTSIGGDDVSVDDWNVDVAVVGSQKCLAAPSGLSMLAVSDRAFDAMREGDGPFYADLLAYRKKSLEKDQTPYTPAVTLFYGLHEALRVIMEEGMENRIKRHRMLSSAVRSAVDALGLEMFPRLNEYSEYSNTVTAVKMPDGITDDQLRGGMRDMGIVISGGQAHLGGEIFRIGTMGNCKPIDVLNTIQALEIVLRRHDVIDKLGDGVSAAEEAMNL